MSQEVVVRLRLEITKGSTAKTYSVLPVTPGQGQDKAFMVKELGTDSPYKVVQYSAPQRKGRRHACSCPIGIYRTTEGDCKHVKALRAVGLLDVFASVDPNEPVQELQPL